ncbi:MAG: hypothetical protein JW759_08995 [Candidatus Coatesbacteria bacterium]|nr:hypothetical protein [Candidatus Coatesbacteria bacterium]
MVEMSGLLRRAREKRGHKLTERERIFIWDELRRAACLGSDPVARRCSMDDYLWEVYRYCSLRGMTLGLDACRHILQTKLLISPLFSRRISRSSTQGDQPCYLSVPDAPGGAGEDGREARQAFDAVFDRLREWIETSGEAKLGAGRGAN